MMKNFKDKVIVVTGGASGIGFAFCKRFAKEGAKVILSDINGSVATEKANEIDAIAIAANVGKEADIKNLVDKTIEIYGQIDLFVSNAGIALFGDESTGVDKWDLSWDINTMAHVYAAKYVIPHMKQKGGGYLLNTVSAAGLTQEFHSAPYTATKYAALGFAEWIATAHANDGIKVSVLCPAGVRTPMTENIPSLLNGALEPDELVEITIHELAKEKFMISTHNIVTELFRLKAHDFEKYLDTMKQGRKEAKLLDQQL
jgi:NAD(P)-dependent dehydrogenase (short-subunit alcohol dehydrogenase family)